MFRVATCWIHVHIFNEVPRVLRKYSCSLLLLCTCVPRNLYQSLGVYANKSMHSPFVDVFQGALNDVFVCDCIWNQPLCCTSYLATPTLPTLFVFSASTLFLSSLPCWVAMKTQWVNRSSPGQLQLSTLAQCPSCECSTHTHNTVCVNWQPHTRRRLTLVRSTHSPLLYVYCVKEDPLCTYVRTYVCEGLTTGCTPAVPLMWLSVQSV